MCRIYGYFGLDLDADALDAARDAQLPGGPDQQRHARGRRWGLGCNRLSIQDPGHGHQPFANPDGTVHAVFNGEIYNFRAIREELARHGVHVEGTPTAPSSSPTTNSTATASWTASKACTPSRSWTCAPARPG